MDTEHLTALIIAITGLVVAASNSYATYRAHAKIDAHIDETTTPTAQSTGDR